MIIACLSNENGVTIWAFQDKHFEKLTGDFSLSRGSLSRSAIIWKTSVSFDLFSIIGGEGYEWFVGCWLSRLNRTFLLDVQEQSGEHAMAGWRRRISNPDTVVRCSVSIRPG